MLLGNNVQVTTFIVHKIASIFINCSFKIEGFDQSTKMVEAYDDILGIAGHVNVLIKIKFSHAKSFLGNLKVNYFASF